MDPTGQTLNEVREQLKLERAKLRLSQARAENRALESLLGSPEAWGNLIDPFDRFRDGDSLDIPWTSRSNRKDGRNGPFVETPEQLDEVRSLSRWLAETNPAAIGIVGTMEDFVVGEGMIPRATSKTLDAKDQLILTAQDVLDSFVESQEYLELQQEEVRRGIRDGEYFERWFPDYDDGVLNVRILEPEHILQPLDTIAEEWGWGIHSAAIEDEDNDRVYFDVQRATHYHWRPDDLVDGITLPADLVNHVKLHVDRNIKRGMPGFYPTAEMLDGVRRLLRNMREGDSVRSAIAGVWEYETATATGVAAHVGNIKDTGRTPQTNPISGKTTNYQKLEPGTFMHVPRGKKAVAQHANVNNPGYGQTVQAVLRFCGVRWRMPEFMVSGDASNANYASTLVAGGPFVRFIRKSQGFFKTRFLRTLWKAIECAWRAGRFGSIAWGDLKRALVIQLEAPTPEIANELEMAQVAQIDMQAGVLSKQTRRGRLGLDNEQEEKNLKADPIAPAAPAGAPASPFGSLPGVAGESLELNTNGTTESLNGKRSLRRLGKRTVTKHFDRDPRNGLITSMRIEGN